MPKKEQPKFPIAGKIVGIVCLCILVYAFFNSVIGDILIEKHGKCAVARIYKEITGAKTGRSLAYWFACEGKKYEGMFPEDGVLKIGDSICVVYYESLPGMNRPLNYFDAGKITCGCGK